MPKIMRDEKQLKALSDIEQLLNDNANLIRFIDKDDADYSVTIRTSERQKKETVIIPPEDEIAFRDLLKKIKKRNSKRILSLAKQFKIDLSEEEMQLIDKI